MKLILFSLLVSCLAFAETKVPDKNAQLEKRIIDLEHRQKSFEKWYTDYYVQSQSRVTPYLGEKISLGGYFESAISALSGTDMKNQSTATGNILGVNLSAEFTEKIRFVSQFVTGLSYKLANPNNNPNLTPTQRSYTTPDLITVVVQGYVEVVQSEALVIQAGLGYIPFGYAFQQRDLVLLRRRGGPQMTTALSDSAFPLWMGLHLSGSFFNESNGRWGYNLYTFTPSTNASALGYGARLWKEMSENLTVGSSFQQGQTANDLTHTYGVDLKYTHANTGVIVEFLRTEYVNATAKSPVSYYVEPFYKFADGEFVVYGFADYLDSPNRMVGAVSDAFERWQYGGGLNWLPVQNTRFRVGYTNSKYTGNTAVINNQGRDFENVDLSVGIAF